MRHVTCWVLCLFLSFPLFARNLPKEKDEYTERIIKLMEITGLHEALVLLIDPLIESTQPFAPGVPDEYWDTLAIRLTEESLQDACALFGGFYRDAFTVAELDDLIHFYESPTGKKFISFSEVFFDHMQVAVIEWYERKTLQIATEIIQQDLLDLNSDPNFFPAQEPDSSIIHIFTPEEAQKFKVKEGETLDPEKIKEQMYELRKTD